MAQEGNYLDIARDDDDAEANGTAEGGEETEQIKEQIAETRSQMSETIDAIQEKLSFANIQEQITEQVNTAVATARDAVLDATVGKATSIVKNISNELARYSMTKTITENPLPFLLIGVGAGLLIYQGVSSSKRQPQRRRALASAARDEDESQAGLIGSARERATQVAGTVTGAAGSAYEKVSGAVGSAYENAGSYVGQARDKFGELGTAARDQYDTYIEENPLAVGAVALALGAAVGFAIPTTSYEGEYLGPVRQDLIDRATETASGLIDKGKDLVSEASKNLSEAAAAGSGGGGAA